jgi:hypothetical protein
VITALAALLKCLEGTDQEPGGRKLEVLELLRKARVHVVDQAETEDRLQQTTPEYRLLVGMDDLIPVLDQQSYGPDCHEQVQDHFRPGRPHPNRLQPAQARDAEDAHARDIDVLTRTISEDIDLRALFRHHHGPVIDAEGRASRGKKRLRGNHEDFHQRLLRNSLL